MYDTSEFVDPKTFKTYDELKSRLDVVLGEATGEGATIKNDSLTQTAETIGYKTVEPEVIKAAPEPEITATTDDDEDTLSYFAKLANEE